MSLVIAAVMFSSAFQDSTSTSSQSGSAIPASATTAGPAEAAAVDSARHWIDLLDREQWQESWQMAATLFKSQISAGQWASAVQPIRQPLGSVSSRKLQSATRTNSLPGAPAGDYIVMQFQTSFARKSDAIETVTVAREGSKWNVAGYFIR